MVDCIACDSASAGIHCPFEKKQIYMSACTTVTAEGHMGIYGVVQLLQEISQVFAAWISMADTPAHCMKFNAACA